VELSFEVLLNREVLKDRCISWDYFATSLFLNLLSQLEQLLSRANLCNHVVTKGVTYKKSYFLFRKKSKIILLNTFSFLQKENLC
jgi:hypothetical protein